MEEKKTGSNSARNSAEQQAAAAARWNDPQLAAQMLLSPSVPFLIGTDPYEAFRQSESRRPGDRLEGTAHVVTPEAAARWSDPQLAAQMLLGLIPKHR